MVWKVFVCCYTILSTPLSPLNSVGRLPVILGTFLHDWLCLNILTRSSLGYLLPCEKSKWVKIFINSPNAGQRMLKSVWFTSSIRKKEIISIHCVWSFHLILQESDSLKALRKKEIISVKFGHLILYCKNFRPTELKLVPWSLFVLFGKIWAYLTLLSQKY